MFKVIFRLSLLFALVLAASTVFGWEFGTSVVKVKATPNNRAIQFQFDIAKGYGVQKKGENILAVYEGSKSVYAKKEIKALLRSRQLRRLAQTTRLRGKTAIEDSHYYSALYPWTAKVQMKKGKYYYLIGKLYFCSFADKFCSVQSVAQPLN